MTRWFASVVAALALFAVLPAFAAADKPDKSDRAKADHALQKVNDLRKGVGVLTGREMTPALADLNARRGALDTVGRKQADALLARPTDGNADPQGDGWSTAESPNSPLCTTHFCIHWVDTTTDAPPSADANTNDVPDYVEQMADVFENEVFPCENGATSSDNCAGASSSLGWPLAPPDAGNGGSDAFDVYLKQLCPLTASSSCLFGYVAPEQNGLTSYSYLVMDNDFAESEFGYPDPLLPMQVTAAHEYNHVLQFGIDAIEDTWMAESTATYMEDKVYPAVNDYLNYMGTWVDSIADPLTDANGGGGLKMYGSAVWNHFLAGRFGDDVVLDAWNAKAQVDGGSFAPGSYSAAIAAHSPSASPSNFTNEFVDFSAAAAEWEQPGQGFPDMYPEITTRPALTVGSATSVSNVDHTTFKFRNVDPAEGIVPLTMHATMPVGLDGGIALVGRSSGGTVITQVARTFNGGVQTVTLAAGNYDRITAVFVNADVSQNGFGSSDWKWTADKKSFSNVLVSSGPPPPPPTANTDAATAVAQNTATLNGTIAPMSQSTGFYFQYGTSTAYGSEAPVLHGTAGSGTGPVPVSATISGLSPSTTYHFRVVAQGVAGDVFGADQTFTTLAMPTAATPPGDATPPTATDPAATPTTDPAAQPRANPVVAKTPLTLSLLVTKARLAAAIKKGLKARGICSSTCTVRIKVVLSAKDAKRLHLSRTIATARGRGDLTLKLRLSKRAAKVLARLKSVRMTVTATATTNDGRTASRSKRVTLRR
jgi:hypothetical protein